MTTNQKTEFVLDMENIAGDMYWSMEGANTHQSPAHIYAHNQAEQMCEGNMIQEKEVSIMEHIILARWNRIFKGVQNE